MHELSIVTSILDTIEENARKRNAKVVHEIELEVGVLSGVELEALRFAIENAPKSAMMKNVKFHINIVQPLAKCASCQHQFETKTYNNPCPQCGDFKTRIVKGDEMKIKTFSFD